MRKLVIAEKPSVARSIAAVIGAEQKRNGYLEGNGYLVSWCVGHLVELAQASVYNTQYQKWRREDLPIIPNPWQYVVSEGTKQQFAILRRLMNAPDVESVICATDAGREGELIFRLVYEQCGCHKPVQRLWISSMEEAAIADGFRNLRPSADYDALYQAALCRARADWLVGINATRLYSTMYHQLLNIGRVMTPTLSMLVTREAKIAAFQPKPFYTVRLDCGSLVVESQRIADHAEAEHIAARCDGREARVASLETKAQMEKPPKLYDLTSLQREANRLLGYTAQQTLDYLQALYEKRLSTYPRTDSRYLTSDMADSVQALVGTTAKALPFAGDMPVARHVGQVIDNKKVSDHHALIPTAAISNAALSALPAGERSILTLLMTRLLCAVGDPHRFDETTVTAECEGISFSASGKAVTDMGWKAIDKAYHGMLKSAVNDDATSSPALPVLNDQMSFIPVSASVKAGQTTPPKHYTEDTLLAAMETAGAEELPDNAERKGLGTPATRAAILEKLVKVGFMERKGGKKNVALLPTPKGASLITVLPEELQSPLLTAEWEQQLKLVERGEQSPEAFMEGITNMVRDLVGSAQPVTDSGILFESDLKAIGTCPRCGGAVAENRKGFVCANRDCCFALWKENRFFASKHKELTAPIAAALLKEGRVFVKGLYSEKTGRTYNATVVLDDTGEQHVNFKLEFNTKETNKK